MTDSQRKHWKNNRVIIPRYPLNLPPFSSPLFSTAVVEVTVVKGQLGEDVCVCVFFVYCCLVLQCVQYQDLVRFLAQHFFRQKNKISRKNSIKDKKRDDKTFFLLCSSLGQNETRRNKTSSLQDLQFTKKTLTIQTNSLMKPFLLLSVFIVFFFITLLGATVTLTFFHILQRCEY